MYRATPPDTTRPAARGGGGGVRSPVKAPAKPTRARSLSPEKRVKVSEASSLPYTDEIS